MSLLQLLRLGGKIGVIGRYASQFLMRNKEFHDKEFLIRKTKNRLVLKKVFLKLKLNCWRKIIAKFKIRKILMYKNAKKKIIGGVKNCVQKYKGFFGKNCALFLFTFWMNQIKIQARKFLEFSLILDKEGHFFHGSSQGI